MSRTFDVIHSMLNEADGTAASEGFAGAVIDFRKYIEEEFEKLPKAVVEALAAGRVEGDKTFSALYDRFVAVEAYHWLLRQKQLEKARALGCAVYCVYHDQDMALCDPKDHGMEVES